MNAKVTWAGFGGAAAALVGLTFAVIQLGEQPQEMPVTEAEAKGVLDATFVVLSTGGARELCSARPDSTFCEELLVGDGAQRAPSEPPTVLESRALPTEEGRAPGRILLVCGRDGLGDAYESEFLVQRRDGQLNTPYPVFWIEMRIASSPEPQLEPRPWSASCPT